MSNKHLIKKTLFLIFGYPLAYNAIFRGGIARATYDALNPEPKFLEPFTCNVGNPNPQFTKNYEINSTYNDFPIFLPWEQKLPSTSFLFLGKSADYPALILQSIS